MLRPTDTFEVFPDGEGEGKPSLKYQARSAAYWIDYRERYAALMSRVDDGYLRDMAALVSDGLVGWTGYLAEFGTTTLAEVLDLADLHKLAAHLPTAALLSALDAKKSERQSQSSTGDSAANAETTAA